MFRLFARFWAKRRYIWRQEVESSTNDLNAGLASLRAQERRKIADQLNAEADEIEANIKREEETEEYKALTGKEKYDADHEKREAEKIVAEKRALAKQELEELKGSEDAAKYMRKQAAMGRATAEKLRRL